MARLESRDPATDEVLGAVEVASARTVKDAVEAARQAQWHWAARPLTERIAVAARFRRILFERREEAARLVSRESGKPLAEARMADVLAALEVARHLEGHAERTLAARKVRIGNPILFDRQAEVTREPLGVVAVIAPWNYPLAIPTTGVLTALVAGNAVVLKPSEKTPLVGGWLVERLHEAGAPADVVQVVHGEAETGKALVEADVDSIVFTGSVPTGQAVAVGCAARFRHHILELGGKDPMVVLDGAEEGLVVAGATWGAFSNAGQTCASVERLYVPEAARTTYLPRLTAAAQALTLGHGMDDGVQMGPLIDDEAVKRVRHHIHDAEKRGAHIETGGGLREDLGPRFVEPTVLSGVNHDMLVMQEETFGPVLPVHDYGHIDEAVHLANDSPYGLTASVWGPTRAAREVAGRIEAGTVTVNDCLYTYAVPETPWGGWKQSGVGASHGEVGLLAMTQWRHVHTARAGRGRSPWYFPYDDRLDAFLDGGLRFLHGGARGKAGGGRAARAWWKRR